MRKALNKFHKFMKSGRIYKVARLAGIESKNKEEKDVRKKDRNRHRSVKRNAQS